MVSDGELRIDYISHFKDFFLIFLEYADKLMVTLFSEYLQGSKQLKSSIQSPPPLCSKGDRGKKDEIISKYIKRLG